MNSVNFSVRLAVFNRARISFNRVCHCGDVDKFQQGVSLWECRQVSTGCVTVGMSKSTTGCVTVGMSTSFNRVCHCGDVEKYNSVCHCGDFDKVL